MNSSYVLATHEVAKRYGSDIALAGVSLRVPEGAVYALAGANGAGKSTLLKVLLNLEPADSGRMEILGFDTLLHGPEARAQVGYVPDQSDPGQRSLTCAGLQQYAAAYYPGWDAAYAERLVRAFGLQPHRRLASLSKGENRRVQLLLALAHRPPVLLLDEPTDGLDPVMRGRLLSLLAGHLADTPTTVLIATHQMHELEKLADHIGILRGGRLVAQMSREELQRTVGRYRVEVPSGWQATPELHLAGVRETGAPEAQWTLIGDRHELIGQLAITGAIVRDVRPLGLEEATLSLLEAEHLP